MADSSEPAFLFLYRKEAVAPVDYLSTFATAPFCLNTMGRWRSLRTIVWMQWAAGAAIRKKPL